MKRAASLIAILILFGTIGTAHVRAQAPSATSAGWAIDRAHSRVTFTVTKWGFVEVEGRFLDFGGTLSYNAAHPEQSRVDWRVKIASIETGATMRDKSLQDVDYFDTARYPEMRFVSDHVKPLQPGQIEVQGLMTIRGVTKPLTVKVACGGTHVVPGEGTFEIFQTEFTLDRYDYGVKGGLILGPVISRDVNIKIIGAVNHQ
jgi:polyisoprenoid-binding protein YceI